MRQQWQDTSAVAGYISSRQHHNASAVAGYISSDRIKKSSGQWAVHCVQLAFAAECTARGVEVSFKLSGDITIYELVPFELIVIH